MDSHHVIWGKVEEPDSEDSRSISAANHSADFSAEASRKHGHSRKAQAHQDISRYLEGVTYANESSESAGASSSAASPSTTRQAVGRALGSPTPRKASTSLARSGEQQQPRDRDLCLAVHSALDAEFSGVSDVHAAEHRHLAQGRAPPKNTFGDSVRSQARRIDDDSDDIDEVAKSDSGVCAIVNALEDRDQKVLIETLVVGSGPEVPTLTEFWSAGAANHPDGLCRPCHYIHTSTGCANGAECDFCHLPHMRRNKPRPCKTKREQCKRFVEAVCNIAVDNPDLFRDAIEVVAADNSRIRTMLDSGTSIPGATSGGIGSRASPGDSRTPTNMGRKFLLSL